MRPAWQFFYSQFRSKQNITFLQEERNGERLNEQRTFAQGYKPNTVIDQDFIRVTYLSKSLDLLEWTPD
jgi:hypothetical protein